MPRTSRSKDVERLVKRVQKGRINWAYYDKYFEVTDLRRAGIVQDFNSAKTRLDLVQLNDPNRNEFIQLFGFEHKPNEGGCASGGSYFSFKLSIVSIYPDGPSKPASKWRLAKAELLLVLVDDKDESKAQSYSYECEQLLDYASKLQHEKQHESSNIYKLGSVSLETIQPFSLSRLLFNGLMRVESCSQSVQYKPMRLSISCHPTCDKFDYQYLFDSQYTSRVVLNSLGTAFIKSAGGQTGQTSRDKEAERLLALVLEDRIDQPLMFEGQLEALDEKQPVAGATFGGSNSASLRSSFTMWGAKVKKFTDTSRQLTVMTDQGGDADEAREYLFALTDCGHQIHLSRPLSRPNLLYGLVHSSFDYASALHDARLFEKTTTTTEELELPFNKVNSFAELKSRTHTIKVRAFQKKDYTLEFQEDNNQEEHRSKLKPIKITVNGYQGRALLVRLDVRREIKRAQEMLLVMNIRNELITSKLAEERLLGGKGNSLVQLTRLVHHEKRLARIKLEEFPSSECHRSVGVSVPRGLILTSKAYESWLTSDSAITSALRELDASRRALAARSALQLDPLARDYLSPVDAQSELKAQCEKTRSKLVRCPLPSKLAQRLRQNLIEEFGSEEEGESALTAGGGDGSKQHLRAFAVRSSCVGEDSLETSAAGQMKTFLGVRGFDALARAIIDCWASQFELEALTYKSQNGLQFNLPMAVVVQELIECYAAGVAATCDPLTGNKLRLEITANLGLGEGVVAGKQTDTIRVSCNDSNEPMCSNDSKLKLGVAQRQSEQLLIAEKLPDANKCCLNDAQIKALAHLLLELRNASEMKEREVEWGITLLEPFAGAKGSRSCCSSSSSSDSSSTDDDPHQEVPTQFHIHLLQSRPLTHLTRLSSREIQHELDSGMPCPRDLVSRANLGEVMPGAMCPLNLTWFNPIVLSYLTRKPFERDHTRNAYVAENLASYGQMAVSMITSSDSAGRLVLDSAEETEKSRAILYSMVGSTLDDFKDDKEKRAFEMFCREKVHPLKPDTKIKLGLTLSIDMAIFPVLKLRTIREIRKSLILEDLIPLENLLERIQTTTNNKDLIDLILYEQIVKLYERLLVQVKPVGMAWVCHMLASLTSVVFNTICLKILSEQPQNKSKNETSSPLLLTSTEVLNDFAVLSRGSCTPAAAEADLKQTESGDISRLLNQLLESFIEQDQLEQMRAMSIKQLYEFLTEPTNRELKCCKLYADFMHKNGHRAWKEFCLSTHTWQDKPSSIVKLLAMRLKSFTLEEAERERHFRREHEKEHQIKLARVLGKIESNKFLLIHWAIPRARNATIRREQTKSMLIKVIHKYRLAFRHLGGLLCLAGLLPSADLIFQLSIEELDEIIRRCCSLRAEPAARDNLMPRLLYKARRRQQRARIVDKVTWPRPTLPLEEMIRITEEQTCSDYSKPTELQQQQLPADQQNISVKGLISCSGRVTGRACVISSLEEADQIEPNDILITYSIDISWSVYFYKLAGIVTEVGGIVSHGAVVAREYGLPTLCTAVGAGSKFKTGQVVTLDADRGVCYLVPNSQNLGHLTSAAVNHKA